VKSAASLLREKKYREVDRPAEIVFTSGTTGVPKGVVVTGQNILSNLTSIAPVLPDLKGARIISVLPLSHMLEQMVGLFWHFARRTVYYLPKITGVRLLAAFGQYRPTHQIFVPQLLKIFWNNIEEKVRKDGKWDEFTKALVLPNFFPFSYGGCYLKKFIKVRRSPPTYRLRRCTSGSHSWP